MAKTTSKRKSDSALPTSRSTKHVKILAPRNDEVGSSQEADESSDQLFAEEKKPVPKYVKKTTTAVKSRKSEPILRVAKKDEYEEDEGRMDSQNFLALVEFESKKKKRAAKAASEYMDRFNESIISSNDALKMRLANLTAASESQSLSFHETFRNAFGHSRPLPEPSPSKNPSPEDLYFVTLFDHSETLIESAKSLISNFYAANEKTASCNVEEYQQVNWEDELDAASRTLVVGCNVNLEKYQALLQGASEPVLEEDDREFVKVLEDGDRNGVDGGNGGVEFGYGWGKVAKKEEKAARKFVRFQREEVVA